MRGYRQEDVCKQIGVTHSVVSHWELGRCAPTLKNVVALQSLFPEVFGESASSVTVKQLNVMLPDVIAERDFYKDKLDRIMSILEEEMK